jgi:hypothetical protein
MAADEKPRFRETSRQAFLAVINSLTFARCCQACAAGAFQVVLSHPEDARFTRQEIAKFTNDTNDSISRRCIDLVEMGVFRENGTRFNKQADGTDGHEATAYEFTGEWGAKGQRPYKRAVTKIAPSEALSRLIVEVRKVATEAGEVSVQDGLGVAVVALAGLVQNLEYYAKEAEERRPRTPEETHG